MSAEVNCRPLRVCYFGTYRADYARNRIMRKRLTKAGIEVVECHAQLWKGSLDRVDKASGGWRSTEFSRRALRAYKQLIVQHKDMQYDVMICGYPGQFDVFLARILSSSRRKPLVLDILMSLHLIASERGLTRQSPVTGYLLFGSEAVSLRLPDMLLMDTPEYVTYLRNKYKINEHKFRLLPLGADDEIYYPVQSPQSFERDQTKVIFFGSFIPLHGVEYIIEAADILRNEPGLTFELIGDGPLKQITIDRVNQLRLKNVMILDPMSPEMLREEVASASICLGVFGTTQQSLCTVQNKIYECLAMGKPLITGDSPLMRREFEDGRHLLLCERASGFRLAMLIKVLKDDFGLQRRLAEEGYRLFRDRYCIEKTSGQLRMYLEELVARRRTWGDPAT